jgi:hypothetical protein
VTVYTATYWAKYLNKRIGPDDKLTARDVHAVCRHLGIPQRRQGNVRGYTLADLRAAVGAGRARRGK